MRKSALLAALSLGCLNMGALFSCDSEREIEMGQAARALAVADLNHDGRADLVVSSTGEPASTGLEPEQLLVRLGTGRRAFGEIVRSAGPDSPADILLADLDADVNVDVTSIVSYGFVKAFMGAGTGAFLPGAIVGPCDTRSPSGGVGRFDQDAASDVAILCRGDGSTYMVTLFSRPGPSFEFGHSYNLAPVVVIPSALASGDLNGDAAIDLVLVGGYGGQASAIAHLNDGSGRFQALTPAPAGDAAVALADMDGDSVLDAVTAGASLAILPGNGDGTFEAAHTIFSGVPLEHLAVSDMNSDGAVDIATIGGGELSLFIARPNGEYARRVLAAGLDVSDLAIADFDKNPWGDIAVLNRNTPSTVTIHFDAALPFRGRHAEP